jgi:hypothetical protein
MHALFLLAKSGFFGEDQSVFVRTDRNEIFLFEFLDVVDQ